MTTAKLPKRLGFFTRLLDQADPAERYRLATAQIIHAERLGFDSAWVKTITGAGRIAGCRCPDSLIPKFLGLGVQYFHSSVGRLLQHGSETYLQKVRQAAADVGK